MATDPFYGASPGPTGPYTHLAVITPSDASDFAIPPRGFYISVSGTIALLPRDHRANDIPIVLANLQPGVWHPIWTRRIFATGTTAAGIVVGW